MRLLQDLHFSTRVLRKSPGHTATCIGLVVLSICVGMIALTLVYNLFFKPLNFVDADRWVSLAHISQPGAVADQADGVNSFHYHYINENNSVFENLGALRTFSISRMHFGETATRISSAEITPHIFAATGIDALLGRTLWASDADSDQPIAVISYSLWKNIFASDPTVVGKVVELDETPVTIVGVMPEHTAFGIEHDVWIAFDDWIADRPDAGNVRGVTPVGKLKPGISLAVAQQQLTELTRAMQQKYPDFFTNTENLRVIPFKQFLMSNSAPIYYSIAIFSALIVILGAINIANLLVSRTIERMQEFAIRNCVGSSMMDTYRQTLVESMVICLSAFIIAIPATVLGMSGVNSYLSSLSGNQGWSPPEHWYLSLDWASLSIASLVLLTIWLICGIGPALRLRKLNINELVNSNKGSDRQTSFRSTKILVGTQIVAAFFILIVSGSLFVSIIRVVNADYGIATENRFTVDLEFPTEYWFRSQDRILAVQNIESLLNANPSIEQAVALVGLPQNTWRTAYTTDNRPLENINSLPKLQVAGYTPEAFEIMGIDIVQGRTFERGEAQDEFIPVVIDQQLAQLHWPEESPLGKQVTIQLFRQPNVQLTVVGVSTNVLAGLRQSSISDSSTIYIPIEKQFPNMAEIVVHSKQASSNAALFALVRDAVAKTDSRIAVYQPRTMQEHLLGPTSSLRMIANIFIGFAIIAVVLAIVGVFAVISRSVFQQAKHIGIRRAVGSSKARILAHYSQQGALFLVFGALIGGSTAVGLNLTLADAFNELPNATPYVALFVFIGLGLLTAFASLVPTLKVLKAEPGEMLYQN